MTAQQRLVLVICVVASFVVFLDGSVINVALPAMSAELGGGLITQQWIVDGYMITLGSLMLVAGSFSDIFGRQKILIFGLVGFALTSLLCAFAPNASFLIASRILQGIAGALLVPSSLALIISSFSGPAQGKAIGSWTAWTGIAFVVGPLLGGFLVDAASWRWIFAINLLPIVLTLGLIYLLRTPDTIEKGVKVDVKGAIVGAIALGGPVYALIEQSHYGWTSPLIYLPLIIGVVAMAYFIWHEKQSTHPMLPLGLFTARNFSVGNVATTFIYAALAIATFVVTIFVQQVGHYSALQAGFALLPVTIIMFLLSPRFGALAGKFGPRAFMAIGPTVAGFGFLSMIFVNSTVHYWSQLFGGVLLFGLGLSITVAPLTTAVLGSIDSHHAGIGSAINNAISRIAGLVAIAGIGLVTGPSLGVPGFRRSMIVLAVLLFIGGLVSAIGIQNHPPKKTVTAPSV